MPSHYLNERTRYLLKVLVDRYIREGQPVGSRTLSRDVHLDLSPATIRNIMADLEEMGLVRSPHTSSGRIPTVKGYRLFVDTLLHVKPLAAEEEALLRTQFTHKSGNQPLLEQASYFLSEVTHLTSVISLPKRVTQALRHVEFLPLSDNRVLVILVINDHEVQNRIIHTQFTYSAAQLEQAANYLNTAFLGKDLQTVRSDLLQELQQAQQSMDTMLRTVVEEMAGKAFEKEEDYNADCLISGQTNLMDVAELSSVEKLRELFVAFNQKYDILQLLDKALQANGVKIFIGEEAGYEVFEECSVITSPYKTMDGTIIGVLGVIGPTRIAYERIIPIVDLTAKLLGSALNPH